MDLDCNLHRLGWKDFQHLCGTILRETLGQTYQVFADSNDGGRDGAYLGTWQPRSGEMLTGSFTIQCKHTSRCDHGLSLGSLKDEMIKAESLAARGLCDNYILLTNMGLGADAASHIEDAFKAIPGVTNCLVYGRQWIEAEIRNNSKIRRLIPRLYGLGDLSQILDERAHSQARSILDHLGDDFNKFVTTDALRQSAEALEKKNFVFLLGEPCCGKSTIASSLALGAADQWGCGLVFVESPESFKKHWNPDNPNQFFWVDDAFGSTQYERDLALEWNRVFPSLQAAIKSGARIVFTSRDYIYKAAIDDLKDQSFTLIRDSQVVIRVENLEKDEKQQILYNHIKLGNQPTHVKRAMKDCLEDIAAHPNFLPETARRLGNSFFTQGLAIEKSELIDMVANMRGFLLDNLKIIGRDNTAAVALVFMRAGNLDCDLVLTESESHALELLGSNVGEVRKSLRALSPNLLLKMENEGKPYWRFKHPSIRDAFGSLIAEDPSLTDIYLANTPMTSLLSEIACGLTNIEGIKLRVPSSKFDIVCRRLEELDLKIRSNHVKVISFLRDRCDVEFLKVFLGRNEQFVKGLRYVSWLKYCVDAGFAAKLHSYGLLSDNERKRFADKIAKLTCLNADAAYHLDPDLGAVLLSDELKNLREKLKRTLLLGLRREITAARDRCNSKSNPWQEFYTCRNNAVAFSKIFSAGVFGNRVKKAISRIDKLTASFQPKPGKEKAKLVTGTNLPPSDSRSIFDDVDE